MKQRKMLAKRLLATVCLMASVMYAGCSSRKSEGIVLSQDSIMLHVDYRSGGDAPVGFLMSFLLDGKIAYFSPRWERREAQLSDREHKELEQLVSVPEFIEAIERQRLAGPRFGCCDAHEVGVFLRGQEEPAAIVFESSIEIPQPILEVLEFVDRVGRDRFLREYRLAPLPVGSRN